MLTTRLYLPRLNGLIFGTHNNQRVTLRPIRPIVQPHPTVADMDLESVPVMLQFVHPARPSGRLLGDNRKARMDESSSSAFDGLPRELRHNMPPI